MRRGRIDLRRMLDCEQCSGPDTAREKTVTAKIAMPNTPIGKAIPSATLLIIERVPSSYDLVILKVDGLRHVPIGIHGPGNVSDHPTMLIIVVAADLRMPPDHPVHRSI